MLEQDKMAGTAAGDHHTYHLGDLTWGSSFHPPAHLVKFLDQPLYMVGPEVACYNNYCTCMHTLNSMHSAS